MKSLTLNSIRDISKIGEIPFSARRESGPLRFSKCLLIGCTTSCSNSVYTHDRGARTIKTVDVYDLGFKSTIGAIIDPTEGKENNPACEPRHKLSPWPEGERDNGNQSYSNLTCNLI